MIKRLTPEIVDAFTAKNLNHVSWKLKDPYHFVVSFHEKASANSMPAGKFKKKYLGDEDYTIDYIDE